MELEEDNPFSPIMPRLWLPHTETAKEKWADEEIYAAPRAHGVKGKMVLHNLNDSINHQLSFLDNVLLEYQIGKQSYPLFHVRDFFEVGYPISEEGRGNLTGDIAERLARRVVKYFLKHLSADGDTGGIFDRRFNPAEKDGYIITNNDRYILKIHKYPNIVLLRRKVQSEWNYDVVKELDGLFDYRCNGQRHILVLESKLDKLQLSSEKLVTNLFEPLRELFPKAHFHYILFSNAHSLFKRVHKDNFLKEKPLEIFHLLNDAGVGSFYFSFKEKYEDFTAMASHLITQYKRIAHMRVQFQGTILIDGKTLSLFDRGQSPFMKLVKEDEEFLWREVE